MSLTLAAGSETLPKQKRSRARRERMIAHGMKLLKDRDVDDVSVAEITGGLGYSTGSFYSAFADKAAFFTAVQHEVYEKVSAEIASQIETADLSATGPARRLGIGVDLTLRYFRAHRGVMRSALRYEQKSPDAWAPNRLAARRIVDGLTRGMDDAAARRMRIAVQMVFGTLVNAVLHDPGPLRLHDDAFGEELKRALRPYLDRADIDD